MKEEKEKCPVCGCEKFVTVEASCSGEWGARLITRENGALEPIACTNCGVMRLSLHELNGIRLRMDDKKNKRRRG